MTRSATLTPGRLKEDARSLYPDGPLVRRLIQVHRPLIAPFGEIIARVPDGARLLDIGCGSGLFIALLAAHREISEAVGFDASEGAIKLARAMQARHPAGARMRFEHKDVGQPWTDETFDIVTVIDLFHHLNATEQAETFAKAVQRVRPGGTLIFKDVGRKPVWRAFFSHWHDLVVSREFINIPADDAIRGWADAGGLMLKERQTDNMLWYGHETWVFEKPRNRGEG